MAGTPAAVLNILLTANTLQANAALAKTQAQLSTTGKTAAATGATMKKAMLGIGVAAAGAAAALYKVGEEFDDAYDKIQTRTGATGREMQKLKGVFRDVVGDVPATFDEAATAVGDLNTRLGLSGRPLARMSKQMTELSRLTDTSLSGNVESVSKAFVDWEVKTKDMSKTLDGLFRLSQESGASVEEITSAVQKFGSPLRQLGFSLAEASAMWATFVRAGVNTQTMVPGLKLAISNLTRPTEELGASMQKLGINVGKPDVALQQIFDLLGKESTLSSIEKTGLAMDVFGKRAGADMAEAIRQGRFEVDDMLKVFREGEGTIREQGRRTMDLSEHWQQFTNLLKLQVEPIAKDVFKGLGDLMKDVSKAFKRGGPEEVLDVLIDKLSEAIPKIAEAGGKIGLKLAGAVVKGFVNADIVGRLFIGAMLFKAFGGGAAIQAAGTKLGTKMGKGVPKGLALGIVAATVLLAPEAFKLGEKLGKMMKKPMRDFFRWIVDTFGGVADKVLGAFSSMIGALAGIYDKLAGIPIIGEAFKPVAAGLHDVEDAINGVRDAMRSMREFRDNPLGFTRKLLRDNAGDIGATADALVAMGISYKRATELATKAGDGLSPTIRRNERLLETLGVTLGTTTNKTRDHGRATDRALDGVRKQFNRTSGTISGFTRDSGRDLDRGGDNVGKFKDRSDRDLDRVGDSFSKTTGRSGKMAKGVGQNITALANGVATGLDTLRDNLNKSLAAFKVKKVGYSIKKVANTVGNVVGAQQGAIVPGTGSGDKVPLHLDGRLAAMVEPGELVSVANRTATERLMAVNKAVPRRQDGGLVPHLAKGGGLMAPFDVQGSKPGFVPFMNFLNNMYGPLYVMSGYRPGSITTSGNVSNHASGHAVDISTHESGVDQATGPGSLGGPGAARMDDLHSYMARNIKLPGDFLWRTYTGGNHYNHIHRGITSAEADDPRKMIAYLSGLPGGGAIAESLKRLILKGPKGPLREMGQGALDMAWKAAQAFLNKQGSTPGYGAGISLEDLPPKLRQYNKTYPDAMFPHDAWFKLYQMPVPAIEALAEWAGMPGVTMGQIAHGESNYKPGSSGDDNNDGQPDGYGLWAITRPYGDSHGVNKYGGYDPGMFNPVANAIVAGNMYRAAGGISPWHGTRFLTDPNAHYSGSLLRKHGGLVPGMKQGGVLGSLKDVLGVVRRSDKDNRRQRAVKDFVKDVKGIHLGDKLGKSITELDADQQKWGEYASNAATLAEDGISTFQGKTEVQWLERQLSALFKLRNKLVRAEKFLRERRRELQQTLKFAEKLERQMKKALHKAEKEKEELIERRDAEKKKSNPDKKLIAELDKQIESMDERDDVRSRTYDALRKQMIPAVKGKITNLSGTYATHLERLDSVQGTGMPKKHLKTAAYGVLGGEILTVQQALREAGGKTTARDEALAEDLRTLLDEANRRFAVSQTQYDVFNATPILGAFAEGGTALRTGAYLVGERGPEVVHLSSGDRVSPNPTISTTPAVNVSVTLYEDRDKALVDVNGKEFVAAVKRVNRGQARSGGRVLPGRAGS